MCDKKYFLYFKQKNSQEPPKVLFFFLLVQNFLIFIPIYSFENQWTTFYFSKNQLSENPNEKTRRN